MKSTNNTPSAKQIARSKMWKQISNDKLLYLILFPVILWNVMFKYVPMGGIILAFKHFRYDTGIWNSPWVGFEHFEKMWTNKEFWQAFKNTIIFSLGRLVFHFPTPIFLAIFLNELKSLKLKKFLQTVFTFPHFISWVVLAGILSTMFSSTGIVNELLITLGFSTISPLSSITGFRPFIWISNIWKEIGWDAIIYIAAFASIDTALYEAASIDGANRWAKMRYISWPGIKSTVIIMFILSVGQIMTNGASFDQIFNLYSAPVFSVADTIDTYVYRQSFGGVGANFGYTTAVGLFKSVIGVILLTTTNKIVTRGGYRGLF